LSQTLIPIDTGRQEPYLLEITHHDVPMRGLSASLDGITVVQLSDLHGGFGNTKPVHDEAIRQIHAIAPDLILLTGDYIDSNPRIKDYPIQDMLCQLKARLGVVASLGNHDHRRGPVGTRKRLEQSGIKVLVNESMTIEGGLHIAAIDDLFEGKPDRAATLRDLPDDATSIVLSHNPRLIEKVRDRDVFILSGHTHGAQIALPFPTPKMVCLFHLHCPQVAGWYKNGRARLYVNRGLGVTGKPFRYHCPAEISVFHLLRA
jgi:predicted MPP superfamily phosphohydrolase